jgi:carbonic anhydrase
MTTADRVTAAAAENVLLALENLHAYPVVAERLTAGSLRLHGWCFKIDTAEMFAYEPGVGQFQPLVV